MPINLLEGYKKSKDNEPASYQPKNLLEKPEESFSTSAALAIPRIGSDIIKGGYEAAIGLPKAVSGIAKGFTSAPEAYLENPQASRKQLLAGLGEAGLDVLSAPHQLAQYGANRLHLLPQNVANFLDPRAEEWQQNINQLFGSPQNEGEQALRSTGKNILGVIPALGAGKLLGKGVLNAGRYALPSTYNYEKAAEKILNARTLAKEESKKAYKNVFNMPNPGAEQNLKSIIPKIDMETLNKIPGAETKIGSLHRFIEKPTAETAHKAKSDLMAIKRKMDKKDFIPSEERAQYHALSNTINHLESNMFKNEFGLPNFNPLMKYQETQKGYRENVLPYTTHPAINAYIRNEKLPEELINALSRGKFARQVGGRHPEIQRVMKANALKEALRKSYLGGLGIGGGIGTIGGLGHLLFPNLFNRPESAHNFSEENQ